MRFLDAGILIVGFLNTSKTNSTLECPKESRSVNVGAFSSLALPIFSTEKKTAFSQPERLFHQILHLREPLVGLLAYLLFGIERVKGGRG